MFTNDCCVYTTGKSFDDTKNTLQESVNDARSWYINNNLSINIPKSFCMLGASETNLNRHNDGSKSLDI